MMPMKIAECPEKQPFTRDVSKSNLAQCGALRPYSQMVLR
jgi:hypothetical protein